MEPKGAGFLAEWMQHEIQSYNQQKADAPFVANPPLVEFSGANLCDFVKDGRVFCLLLSALDVDKAESACRTLMRNPQQMSTFHRLERVQFFIKWCRDEWRLDEKDLFTTTELIEDNNERVVCECLTALLQKARPNYKPASAKAKAKANGSSVPSTATPATKTTTSSAAASSSSTGGSSNRLSAFMKRFSGNAGAVASDETTISETSKDTTASEQVPSTNKDSLSSTTPLKSTSRLTIPSAFVAAKTAMNFSSNSSSSNAAAPATFTSSTAEEVPRSHGKLEIPKAFSASTPAPSDVKSGSDSKLVIPSAFSHANTSKPSSELPPSDTKPDDSKLSKFLNNVDPAGAAPPMMEKPQEEVKSSAPPVEKEEYTPSKSNQPPPSSNSKLAAFLAEQHSPPLPAGAPSLATRPLETLSLTPVDSLPDLAGPKSVTNEPEKAMPPPTDATRTASSKLAAFRVVSSQDPLPSAVDPPPVPLEPVAIPEPVQVAQQGGKPSKEEEMPSPNNAKRTSSSKLAAFLAAQPPSSQSPVDSTPRETPAPLPVAAPEPVPTPTPTPAPESEKQPSSDSSSKLAAFLAVSPPVPTLTCSTAVPTVSPTPVSPKSSPINDRKASSPPSSPKKRFFSRALSGHNEQEELLSTLRSELASQHAQELDQIRMEFATKQNELKRQMKQLASDIQQLTSNKTELEQSNQQLTEDKRQLEQKNQQLAHDKSQLEQRVKSLQDKDQLEHKIHDLTSDKSQLEQKNQELTNTMTLLEQQNQDLTDNLLTLQQQSNQATESSSEKQKIQKLTDQLSTLQQQQTEQESELKQLQVDKQDLLTSMHQMEDLLAKASASEEASRFAAQCAFRARDEVEEEIKRLKQKLTG